MKTPRALTLMALALMAGGCENGPTLPEVGTEFGLDTEVQAAAALDQGAAQALAMVEESLGQLPDGAMPDGRPDRARTDSIQRRDLTDRVRPNDRRPDDRRPDDRRPVRDRRAKLAVALGAEAVALAERLLEGIDPSPEQLRHLEHARQLQRRAEAALDEGRNAAAVELAEGGADRRAEGGSAAGRRERAGGTRHPRPRCRPAGASEAGGGRGSVRGEAPSPRPGRAAVREGLESDRRRLDAGRGGPLEVGRPLELLDRLTVAAVRPGAVRCLGRTGSRDRWAEDPGSFAPADPIFRDGTAHRRRGRACRAGRTIRCLLGAGPTLPGRAIRARGPHGGRARRGRGPGAAGAGAGLSPAGQLSRP